MKFNTNELLKYTQVGGRIILFSLLDYVIDHACHCFTDDQEFQELLMKNESVKQISYIPATGVYAITFKDCNKPDDELLQFVALCASKCEFTD